MEFQAHCALLEREALVLRSSRLSDERLEHLRLHHLKVLNLLEGVEVRVYAHAVGIDAIEVARMVGMGMCEQDLNRIPGSAELGQSGIERRFACGMVEPDVDDGRLFVAEDKIRVQLAQGVVGQRYPHAIHAGNDLGDESVVVEVVALCVR